MSLMYSNETPMNRAELARLPTPPAAGRYHRPVPFSDFADLVAHRVERAGFEIQAEEYAVDEKAGKMFGLMEVAPLEGEFIAKDWALQIGLRGSHDQSIARGITLGSRVIVCSNLCFHGDLGRFQTRQTLNVWNRLPELVERAVSRLPEQANANQHRFDAYRLFQMKPRWGDAALVEMHRRGALTAAQLSRAIGEWDAPTYEAHAEDGWTAWRLFNAATEALKPVGASVNHDTLRVRSGLVSDFVDTFVN